MILTTSEELRLFIPTHVIENLTPLAGFIDNSEHDFLLEKVGQPLYDKVTELYEDTEDKDDLLPGGEQSNTAVAQLIHLCQRVVAFDMLYRAADVSAISINESGLNIVETGGYDAADEKTIDRYKRRLYTEAHRAVDRLLVTLEEWAEDEGLKAVEDKDQDAAQKLEFIELWEQSRYYYQVAGLFINTARTFNLFVDIYENREKFIQLLPDLRYVQEFVLRPEMGDELTDYLLEALRNGTLSDKEKPVVRLVQYALALKAEARSTLFDRKDARDEAIGAVSRLMDYLKAHQSDLPEEVVSLSPFYVKPKTESDNEKEHNAPPVKKWENNRRGNKLFVAPPIE